MLPKFQNLLLLSQISLITAFRIISYTQNKKNLEPGQTLHLVCKSETSWEFCLWKHTSSEYSEVEERDCLMEWKRAKGGVSVQKCHEELDSRVTISGDYDSHECGLTVTGLEVEDSGTWECEMEEYKFGDWVSGNKHSHSFDVNVRMRTTTATTTITTTMSTITTSTASTTTTTTSSTTSTTAQITTEKESEINTEIPTETNYPEEISLHIDDKNYGELIKNEHEYDESIKHHDYHQEDNESTQTNTTSERSDTPIYDEDVEALAIEDEASSEVSVGLIAGLVVVLLGFVVGAVGGGMFWNKKRKEIPVVALHKIKDQSGASSSFLEDSEYHVNIMGNTED